MAEPDPGPPQSQWWIGVVIIILSSILLNLGVNLQKLSHIRNNRLPKEEQKNPFKRPLWLFGMALFIGSNVCDLFGYGFGPQSVLAPLGGIGLVSNVFLAHLLLKEPCTRYDVIAMIVVLSGISLCVGFGSRDDPKWTLEQLLDRYTSPGVIAYMSVVAALIVGSFVLIQVLKRWKRRHEKKVVLLVGYLCCLLAGLLGSLTLLLAKSGSLLIQETFNGNDQFTHGSTWGILIFLVLFGIGGVYWMNVGLDTYDALIIVPVYFSFWSIFGIIGGLIYFDETKSMSKLDIGMFPVGVVITLVGTFLVGRVRETVADAERTQNSIVGEGDADSIMHEANPSSRRSSAPPSRQHSRQASVVTNEATPLLSA